MLVNSNIYNIRNIRNRLSQLPYPFATPKLYLNFLFWYSLYLYLSSTALTTPLNLGGVCNRLPVLCETRDAAWKLASALPSYTSGDLLPMSYYLFPLPIADCKRSLLIPFLMYIYLLISIDLQSSRLFNSLYCKAYNKI